MSLLQKIQTELKAPKGQFNKFGKYAYRSQEDILEALKPVLARHQCAVIISDSIDHIGERFYIKATATLYGPDMAIVASNTAYAREPEERKGMDPAQVSGSSSSYARKYALNGLFACDDTKDPDATNTHGNGNNHTPEEKFIGPGQVADLEALLQEVNGNKDGFLKYFKINKLEDLPENQIQRAIAMLEAKRVKNGA